MGRKTDTAEEDLTMSESLTSNPVTPFSPLDPGEEAVRGKRRQGDMYTNDNNREENNDSSYSVDGSREEDEEEEMANSYDDGSYDDEDEDDAPLSLDEFLYSVRSYHAIARPVSVTMMLAALAAVYINNDESLEAGAEQFASAYNVFDLDNSGDSQHNMKNLARSIANTFIMVLAICSMTFGIVLLYKFRCMKILIGYMVFSSATLLGLLGDYMGTIGIVIYRIPVDVISWYLFMYNFAIVGVTAIFYQEGIPSGVTQSYLVFTSAILAWHLSHFDDWTAWTLLVMLAFYDLCAVLSPCGPLKALVNLMSEKDSPDMPGLLYEARLPAGTYKPGTRNAGANATPPTEGESANEPSMSREQESNVNNDDAVSESSRSCSSEDDDGEESEAAESEPAERWEDNDPTSAGLQESVDSPLTRGPTASIPLAIAKLYSLPLVHEYGTSSLSTTARERLMGLRNRGNRADDSDSTNVNTSPLLANETLEEFYQREFTPSELRSNVDVHFPRGGGKVVRERGSHGRKYKYAVYSKTGELRRTLVVDKKGVVYEMSFDDDDSVDEEAGGAIRLGLGDFIFYSVMVAKAAMYSFTTFAACMLVILSGLGGTLILLSVYHSALPALPISIFLGVIFYLLTKILIEPWIEEIMIYPLYV